MEENETNPKPTFKRDKGAIKKAKAFFCRI